MGVLLFGGGDMAARDVAAAVALGVVLALVVGLLGLYLWLR